MSLCTSERRRKSWIYETIKKDLDQKYSSQSKSIRDYLFDGQHEWFEATANIPLLGGENARHSRVKISHLKKYTKGMTIVEGRIIACVSSLEGSC